MEELKKASDDAIAKYGASFREGYGWAAEALNNPRPNFTQIEASLDMAHWRPWFRLACQNVHAGSRDCTSHLEYRTMHQEFSSSPVRAIQD